MKTIDVSTLKKKIDSGEALNLVDVREVSEHDEFNIGGILLPLGNIRVGEIDSIEHLKENEVYLYCRSGNRSGQAALILESMGFTNVTNVVGGMLAWNEQFSM
ncbi:MAG: rhodanese-like domain-containing protein [Chitinophagia bacterium]|nr:rhodanese-like domain-containing protein [Chitinophagia bacterium]